MRNANPALAKEYTAITIIVQVFGMTRPGIEQWTTHERNTAEQVIKCAQQSFLLTVRNLGKTILLKKVCKFENDALY